MVTVPVEKVVAVVKAEEREPYHHIDSCTVFVKNNERGGCGLYASRDIKAQEKITEYPKVIMLCVVMFYSAS